MDITTQFGTVKIKLLKGERGDQGIQGEQGIQGIQGEPFEFEDFTEQQLAELRADVATVYYRNLEETVYTVGDETTSIEIPFEDYTATDMLFVSVEGLTLAEGTDYTISNGSIVLTTPITHSYTAVSFRLLSAIAMSVEDFDNLTGDIDAKIVTEVDAWLTAHPEATTTVQPNTVTDNMLVQTGGVLSEVHDIRTDVNGNEHTSAGDSVRSQVQTLLGAIDLNYGVTEYNEALGGNLISNTNRWFLNGEADGIPRKVHIQTNSVGIVRVDAWLVEDDTLTLKATKRENGVGLGWITLDFTDVASSMPDGTYMLSVITAPNNVRCTIDTSSGFDAYRTTDMTSETLSLSNLLVFDGLCVNGYAEYESRTIAERVTTLESIVNPSGSASNVKTVKVDGSGDYTTIAAAASAAVNGDTILVYPGTYTEPVEAWSKTVDIIGIDKNTCIITNDTGNYATPAVEIDSGRIANLTIISTAENPTISSSTWGYKLDYCIHADHAHAEGKSLIIEDCILRNNHRSALGIGLYPDYTVTVRNCDIWSGAPADDIDSPLQNKRGAVYFHNRQPAEWWSDVTGQKIRLINNTIYCEDIIALYISDTTVDFDMETLGWTNEMEAEFINNMVCAKYANGSYKTSSDGIATPTAFANDSIIGGTGFTDYLKLSAISYGNNVIMLNA